MDLGLKSKRALVLGSSAGIGEAIAKALIEEGAEVVLHGRDSGKLERVQKKVGAKGFVCTDLYQKGSGLLAVQKATQKLGGLDILVTNAGGPPKGGFADLGRVQWEEAFENLWMSVVESIQGVLPEMKDQRYGRILMITSIAAKEPLAGLTLSNGLRAGLSGLAKSLATEVAPHGITVNAILPGYTATERLKDLGVDLTAVAKQIPMGRIGEPSELGSLAAFLVSDRAAYVTGQSILFDGGISKSY